MSPLLLLNKYIIVPVLIEWLAILDFIDLDTAICNQKFRQKFIESIREYPDKFERMFMDEYFILSRRCLVWQLHRRMVLPCAKISARNLVDFQQFEALNTSPHEEVQSWFFNFSGKIKSICIENYAFQEHDILYEWLKRNSFEVVISVPTTPKASSLVTSHKLSVKSISMIGSYQFYLFKPFLCQCSCLMKIDGPNSNCFNSDVILCLLAWCRQISTMEITVKDQRTQLMVVMHYGLRLTNLRITKPSAFLIKSVISCCPRLTELSILDMPMYALEELSHNEHKLKRLSIWCLLSLDDELATHQIRSLTTLEYLSVHCRDASTALLSVSPLRHLTMQYGFNFTKLKSVSSIEKLTTRIWQPLQDFDLSFIGMYCPYLIELDVSKQNNITDAGVEQILRHGRIKHLNISHSSCTEETLSNVVEYCFDIQTVRTTIGNLYAVEAMVLSCRTLRSLYVPTGDNWRQMVVNCKAFNPRLVVYYCR